MNWSLVVAGFLVHLVFFYSIFDIYFTSPIVHGMTPHASPVKPPAKRLVLFVTDGLRADKLFELDENGKSRAPYLRSVMEKRGAWGVSHTRVPTESRPGHVALIAGFYEDVSAVAKGWKENPVEFDSLFNESSHTWSWGSPDILPMFAARAHRRHVHTHTYPADSEDFAGAELHRLDTWVFDNVKEYLASGKSTEELKEDKVVFFMHLLGLDTNGHAYRPNSNEYLSNIGVVDSGIQDVVEKIEEFYGYDNSTAYILSSDHGMTNWGSHGAGHPSETLTPLIAWGAGVRRPQHSEDDQHPDNFLQEWKLQGLKRTDVNQADVCPLMAALIGVPFPLNSVGVLPHDYLAMEAEDKAETLYANALQIVEIYQVKMKQKQETTFSMLFVPFSSLTPSQLSDRMRSIRQLIQQQSFTLAIKETEELMELALEGLNYYHNYDRFFLGFSILIGFLGWSCYVITLIIQHHTTIAKPLTELDWIDKGFLASEKGLRLIFSIVGATVWFLVTIQHLPWTHHIYCILPVILWYKVAIRANFLEQLRWHIIDHGMVLYSCGLVVLAIAGIEIIVLSFFHRELLSLGLVAMAIWPFFSQPVANKNVSLGWSISCLLMAIFPLLPVVGREANYSMVILAGALSIILAFVCSTRIKAVLSTKLLYTQIACLLVSMCVVWSTSVSIASKEGLPLINQVISWIILGLSIMLPLLSSTHLESRLLHVSLSLLPPYLLLSTAHEALFCVLLCVLLCFWLQLENQLTKNHPRKMSELDFGNDGGLLTSAQRKLQLSDLRIAYFFIFLLIVAFFGTGNIASINSFDPASVMCFLTVFSPFVMGALMMGKVLIPFLLVSSAFSGLHVSLHVPTQSLFLLVLLMSDFMAMHFFLLVKDSGSWLDIGTSISHYVIVMAMICFLMILLGISKILTTVSLVKPQKPHRL